MYRYAVTSNVGIPTSIVRILLDLGHGGGLLPLPLHQAAESDPNPAEGRPGPTPMVLPDCDN